MGETLIDLSSEIGELSLKTPLIISSGCFEYDEDLETLMPLDVFGALITKTITLNKKTGNPPPRTCEVTGGLINSIGLQNEGLYFYIKYILPRLENSVKLPIIASIAGFNIEEFAKLASHLDREEKIQALEVNISCPNLESIDRDNEVFAQDPHMSYGVVKAVKESTAKPVIVKLSPEVADIRTIALAVADAGCDAITVANTYPAMAVDINTKRPKLGGITGGLSGPAIKPLTLKKLWEVYKVVDVPLIASGGIMTPEDALEYIITGASFVSLGTVNFVNPKAGMEILKGIRNYLTRQGLTYKELIGSLKIEKV